MSNYWYYGPGTDGSTPTLLLTGTEVADATPYVGTVSQSGEWSNDGYTSILENEWPWEPLLSSIEKVITLDSNPISMNKDSLMDFMFGGGKSLPIKSIDFSGFNTKGVKSMRSMFKNCRKINSLDLSNFDTSNVTNMDNMFNYCSSLKELDLSSFDTSNVTDMSGMVQSCLSLLYLDLSSFDTSNVTDMHTMFQSCDSLKHLDISGFDLSSIVYMDGMISWCESLVSLDISNLIIPSDGLSPHTLFSSVDNLRIIDIGENMSIISSQLPAESYYNVETGESVPRESLTEGTWVRDEADISLVSTMVQNRQAMRSLRHMVNKLSKRVVALETSVSSLIQ